MEEKGKGRNIIFPIIFRLLGRESSGENEKGTEMLGKKIKILKKWGGGWEYISCRELCIPLLHILYIFVLFIWLISDLWLGLLLCRCDISLLD